MVNLFSKLYIIFILQWKTPTIILLGIFLVFQPNSIDSLSNEYTFLHENIPCRYSLEAPQCGAFNEYPQHRFSLISQKYIFCGYLLEVPGRHMFSWRNVKTRYVILLLSRVRCTHLIHILYMYFVFSSGIIGGAVCGAFLLMSCIWSGTLSSVHNYPISVVGGGGDMT